MMGRRAKGSLAAVAWCAMVACGAEQPPPEVPEEPCGEDGSASCEPDAKSDEPTCCLYATDRPGSGAQCGDDLSEGKTSNFSLGSRVFSMCDEVPGTCGQSVFDCPAENRFSWTLKRCELWLETFDKLVGSRPTSCTADSQCHALRIGCLAPCGAIVSSQGEANDNNYTNDVINLTTYAKKFHDNCVDGHNVLHDRCAVFGHCAPWTKNEPVCRDGQCVVPRDG